MGTLFDRSHATIYHWESGETTPGATVMAVMAILRDDLAWREEHHRKAEVENWKARIAREGVEELLRSTAVSRPDSAPPMTTEDLIDRASRSGGLVVKSPDGTSQAFILPFTKKGLTHLLRSMLADPNDDEKLETSLHSAVHQIEKGLS